MKLFKKILKNIHYLIFNKFNLAKKHELDKVIYPKRTKDIIHLNAVYNYRKSIFKIKSNLNKK